MSGDIKSAPRVQGTPPQHGNEPPSADPAPPAADTADEVLRAWMAKGLHEAYAAITREALPERILKLIEEYRRNNRTDGGDTSG